MISDKDLQILLSQKDIVSALAEDLGVQFYRESQSNVGRKRRYNIFSCKSNVHEIKESGIFDSDALSISSAAFESTLKKHSSVLPDSKTDSLKEKVEESKSELSLSSEKVEMSSSVLCPGSLSINMSSSQLLAACKGLGKNGVSNTSIMAELCPPPSPPDPPYPPIPKEHLMPPTPSVFVSNFTVTCFIIKRNTDVNC